MDKKDFINKWSSLSNERWTVDSTINQAMMVDLNLVINHSIKKYQEREFENKNCE